MKIAEETLGGIDVEVHVRPDVRGMFERSIAEAARR